ncbi:MAG: sodium:calcium antiporter [Crenarchaeota archaeon]|mgnify:CR=1 FL=1|nr:MAG: sodium:calcium antiporter [Thermoproteota archaeon]RDJ34344.1 MAG: sodium:calcium antiporter [Thermoproteota archaeon]RDJ37194.1 MAG: sodium:calcium antiporter [Thermoproteota archaeon]RDJ37580.1 MAG: sodium:calcium antiporter [Thermoproteota archaeon]
MELLINGLFVAVGLAMLYFGAEWLVKGSVSIAQKFKISQLVIGLTIVAFGTSTPELSVSVSSAINGVSDVALGNVVGSNIANIGLILGISAIITPIAVARQTIRKEVPIMIGVSVLLLAVSLDAQISMIEGILLAIGVVVFTVFSYKSAKKEEQIVESTDGIVSVKTTTYRSIILIGIGLVLLTIGSFMTVDNAVLIAQNIGISERVIGLTLVAVGTSLPELITSVVAARKGHADLSVGNIVGSNIFNILAIIGISASIAGITVSDSMWSDYYIMIIFALVLLPIMRTGFKISKLEGIALLVGYLIYTSVLLLM